VTTEKCRVRDGREQLVAAATPSVAPGGGHGTGGGGGDGGGGGGEGGEGGGGGE